MKININDTFLELESHGVLSFEYAEDVWVVNKQEKVLSSEELLELRDKIDKIIDSRNKFKRSLFDV